MKGKVFSPVGHTEPVVLLHPRPVLVLVRQVEELPPAQAGRQVPALGGALLLGPRPGGHLALLAEVVAGVAVGVPALLALGCGLYLGFCENRILK